MGMLRVVPLVSTELGDGLVWSILDRAAEDLGQRCG
jgi:hypothetical protein